MRRGFFGIAIGIALLAACGDSTFQGTGDDTSQDGGGDAGDASVDGSTSDASSDGGVDGSFVVPGNLLADPSFESPVGAGCGPDWTIGSGSTTLMLAPVGHTGSHSCLVCGLLTNVGQLGTNPPIEPLSNLDAGPYEFSAWVMSLDSDGGPPTPFVIPGLDQVFHDGGSQSAQGASFTTPTGQWTQVFFDTPLESDQSLQLLLTVFPNETDAGPGGCALVDDVSLVGQ